MGMLIRKTPRLIVAAGPALIVIFFGLLVFLNGRSSVRADGLVDHTLTVISALHRILGRATDAETGQRGFVITGLDRYLGPFEGAESDVQRDLRDLRRMTTNDITSQRYLDTLGNLIDAKFRELEQPIRLRRTQGFPAALAFMELDSGKVYMDGIRRVVAAMDGHAHQVLANRERAAALARRITNAVVVSGTLIAALLALLANGYFARFAEAEADAARALEERATQLQEQAVELEHQNTQLQEQAVELEQQSDQVQQQAIELEVANENLNASAEAMAQAQELLTTERRYLRRVIDINPNFVFAKDREGRFTLVNQAVADAYGTTIENLVGKTDADFNSNAEEVEYFRRLDLEVMDSGGMRFIPEESITDSTGARRWLQTVKCPITDDSGHITQILGVSTNITERKRIEAELRREAAERARLYEAERIARADAEEAKLRADEANQAKSAFLATMSHELRTPLNAIGGYAELLELGVRGPITMAQREDLVRIRRAGQYLLGLINDVLNFVQLESAHVRYAIRTYPVQSALDDAAALIEPQVQLKQLTFAPERCDEQLMISADPDKVQQILLNLLSNAVKFTPPGGQVVLLCLTPTDGAAAAAAVRAASADRVATIIVRDTGAGIPDDKRDSIFEPFVQIGRDLRQPMAGVGLGLAISRQLARGMGGDLAVRSEIGRGSTFILTLPLASVES